jgi:hypothetical protein
MVATGMAVLGEARLCVRTEKAHNLKERSLVIGIYRGWWTKMPRVPSRSSRSTSMKPP